MSLWLVAKMKRRHPVGCSACIGCSACKCAAMVPSRTKGRRPLALNGEAAAGVPKPGWTLRREKAKKKGPRAAAQSKEETRTSLLAFGIIRYSRRALTRRERGQRGLVPMVAPIVVAAVPTGAPVVVIGVRRVVVPVAAVSIRSADAELNAGAFEVDALRRALGRNADRHRAGEAQGHQRLCHHSHDVLLCCSCPSSCCIHV